MKDHENEKRELVNRLTKLARDFAHTEQLRERIAGEVLPALDAARAAERRRCADACRDVARGMEAQQEGGYSVAEFCALRIEGKA